ncbi:MAG: hypothetical protein ACPGAO_04105 [Flavobacteriaceae bacterium]
MKVFKWILAISFLLLAIACFVVVYIMYGLQSFIDTPYLIGGLIFLFASITLFVLLKKKSN